MRTTIRGALRTRLSAPRTDDGFSLVEMVATMCISLLVMALVIPVVQESTHASSLAQGESAAASAARLAVENLQSQAASASQLCLPTELTTGGLAVASGFALRESQQVTADTTRWEQWMVSSSGLLEEEQFTPAGSGTWLPVVRGIVNTSTAPFDLPAATPGAPQQLAIDLQVGTAPTIELQASVSAFDTPYTLAPTTPCATAEPTD